ncbi:CDF family Co(II)/Ni(II) efflux transporter DmeF [Thioalkalicoccus limnaeus]|uniref:CDF family Co(II)/Ni(II) efflux transporter DmeF n=1 Tax=Thioalkalicoccus limnaeus TaxID=120681 RepID=A0ABV4BAU9_9GAMM
MALPSDALPVTDRCLDAAPIHDHDFGQGRPRRAERRTLVVMVLTLVTMFAEVAGGLITGSMALLADGIHMGGHSIALGLAAGAYYLARRHAQDRRFSLGSGKIMDLTAYTSALLLVVTTLWLVVESVHRLLDPQALRAAEALAVAVIGLVVNLVSAWLLAGAHEHHRADAHDDGDSAVAGAAAHGHGHDQDHNLRAALVHVLADALTSIAAIAGLIAAWLWGWNWLDPVIALIAAVVIMKWAIGLLRRTGAILLDSEGPAALRDQVTERLEGVGPSRVTDLHLWSVGQGGWTLVASVVTHASVSPQDYRLALGSVHGLHHPIIEIHHCRLCPAQPTGSGGPG